MDYFDFYSRLLITAAILVAQGIVAIHILMNKREEAASAVLWLLVVFVFPVVGIFLYLLFGINRIKTLGVKISLANDLVNAEMNDPVHEAMAQHRRNQRKFVRHEEARYRGYSNYSRTLDRLVGDSIPLEGNKLELLCDGTYAYPRMLEAVRRAKKSIHLECYLVVDDRIAKSFFDELEKKAAQGVEIKVLYDKFGSYQAILAQFFKKYSRNNNNMQVVPFAHSHILAPWRIQLRNHRKLLIIDGKVAFSGGINISSENIIPPDYTKDKHIHDLHTRIEGPAVGEFQFCFLRDWAYATKTSAAKVFTTDFFPEMEKRGDSIVRVISSGPGHDYKATEKVFFTAASTAKKYIWIMTPYFVPDKSFIKALCMSAARGVEVRLIVPAKTNHWYVQFATHSLYEVLLKNGIRIFEKKGPFSHAKAMLVDGEWAYMGSSNCDVRSFRLNFELDFTVSGGEFVYHLHSQFKREFKGSEEVDFRRELNKPFTVELLEDMCALLTPIL